MKHSTPNPTKAQERRFGWLYEIGCICCRKDGLGHEPAQIHHILSGGTRMGHDYTIPLCPWHHKGEPKGGYQAGDMALLKGPSLALHKRQFVRDYGTELELLDECNRRVELLEAA